MAGPRGWRNKDYLPHINQPECPLSGSSNFSQRGKEQKMEPAAIDHGRESLRRDAEKVANCCGSDVVLFHFK
jgi:hypothetical protein